MKVSEIRMTVEAALNELGFDGGLWCWRDRPNRLEILIREEVRTLELRSGISRRRLNYELGKIDGWSSWAPRNKPARPVREYPKHEPGVQLDIEDLL